MLFPLRIRIKKISPTHHSFQYIRFDGSGEILHLETKTFLLHDFIHFAVETEAKLSHSFYGLLSESTSYARLQPNESMTGVIPGEVGVTERIVGPMTAVIKAQLPPHEFIKGIEHMFSAHGEKVPTWLTERFVVNVQERMRKLLGEWKKIPFGESMEIVFNPND